MTPFGSATVIGSGANGGTRRSASAILILLLVSVSLNCASSSFGKSLNVGVGLAKVADQLTTDHAESRGAVEANPIVGSSQWRQVVLGSLGVGSVIGIAQLVESKGNHVLAHVIRAVSISLWSAVAVRNYQIGRSR